MRRNVVLGFDLRRYWLKKQRCRQQCAEDTFGTGQNCKSKGQNDINGETMECRTILLQRSAASVVCSDIP